MQLVPERASALQDPAQLRGVRRGGRPSEPRLPSGRGAHLARQRGPPARAMRREAAARPDAVHLREPCDASQFYLGRQVGRRRRLPRRVD